VTAETHTKRSGLSFTYYRCTRRQKDVAICSKPYLAEPALEAELEATFGTLSVPEKYVKWALRRIDALEKREQSKVQTVESSLRRELVSKEQALDRLTNLAVQGHLTSEEFLKTKTKLLGEKAEIEQGLADPAPQATVLRKLRETVIAAAEAPDAFREGNSEERRRLVSELCASITLKTEEIEVQLLAPFALLAGQSTQKGANRTMDNEITQSGLRKRSFCPPRSALTMRRSKAAGVNPRRTNGKAHQICKNRALGAASMTTFSQWWTLTVSIRSIQ
jgi:hypothetical protein